MLRLLAAVICLGFGGPVVAASPDAAHLDRGAPRAMDAREDAADLWLRESAPGSATMR